MKRSTLAGTGLPGLCLAAQVPVRAAVVSAHYGRLPDGRATNSHTLTNAAGLRVTLLNDGVLLASFSTPDRDGKQDDITPGNDTLAGWLANDSYMSATIGRYANRIAPGRFTLAGKVCQLATNNGSPTL